MSLLRSIAILTLVLLMLPWGAYSAAFPAPAGAAAQRVFALPQGEAAPGTTAGGAQSKTPSEGGTAPAVDGRSASVTASADTPPRVAPAPRRCRTAILTGSACGADGAVLAAADRPLSRPAPSLGPAPAGCWRAGLAPETDPDPPRSC